MTTLIIDTSSPMCLIGLAQDGAILDQLIYPHDNTLSATLLPAIQELLGKHHLSPTALGAVAIGMGPGSYTGTRVGVAVGKSLQFALGLRFSGFCSLLAFLPETSGPFALILPTRTAQFYLLQGIQIEKGISVHQSGLIDAEDLEHAVKHIPTLHCNTAHALPAALHNHTIYPLKPHLPALMHVLTSSSSPLSNTHDLIYLHTPCG